MITPEVFNRNDVLRKRLAASLDILELAFTAADTEEDERQPTSHDALAYAMSHAERAAIVRYKQTIRAMAKVPREQVGPLEASYNGVDPFDQIGLDAEQEHAQANPQPDALSRIYPNPKTKKE